MRVPSTSRRGGLAIRVNPVHAENTPEAGRGLMAIFLAAVCRNIRFLPSGVAAFAQLRAKRFLDKIANPDSASSPGKIRGGLIAFEQARPGRIFRRFLPVGMPGFCRKSNPRRPRDPGPR